MLETCPSCGGSGQLELFDKYEQSKGFVKCPYCNGSGKVNSEDSRVKELKRLKGDN